jgi:glycosyltransferase involved in cell wall biosynthesis
MSVADEITVVIPVWDAYVPLLLDAVESVREDSPGTSIVVVDNASGTALPDLPGCRLVRSEERLSAGAARNLGLEHVETPYVVFLDADDMLLEGTLEFLHSRMVANPSLSISATAILDVETGERHRTPRRFVAGLATRRHLFALADSIWSLLPLQGCAILRTAQVRDAGGYADANWGEDWVLAASLVFRGRVELSDRLGRLYRPTPDSLWRRGQRAHDLAESAARVRDRLRTDRSVPGWVRAMLPLIALLQLSAAYLVRPLFLGLRRLVGSRTGRGDRPEPSA